MKQNVRPFVLMESINRTKESINTEHCSVKQNSFPGVLFIFCHPHLPPSPVSAWFELLPITGWREASQLLKPAVTQAYLNRDLPLRLNSLLNLIILAVNANWGGGV